MFFTLILVDVSAESFVKLSNLIELDLSNNSLTTIPSQSLAECPGLRRLSLAGNRISDIKSRSFLPLIKLNWLDLSRNVIYHLDSDAFIGLRSLQMLKIQSNRLQTIMGAHSFVNYLSKRLSLEMHDNQWHCDCHLGPLRDWILENSISIAIKPICSMPERLKGNFFFPPPPRIRISFLLIDAFFFTSFLFQKSQIKHGILFRSNSSHVHHRLNQ